MTTTQPNPTKSPPLKVSADGRASVDQKEGPPKRESVTLTLEQYRAKEAEANVLSKLGVDVNVVVPVRWFPALGVRAVVTGRLGPTADAVQAYMLARGLWAIDNWPLPLIAYQDVRARGAGPVGWDDSQVAESMGLATVPSPMPACTHCQIDPVRTKKDGLCRWCKDYKVREGELPPDFEVEYRRHHRRGKGADQG